MTERKRGRGFPVVPLPEAVEALGRIARYGSNHSIGAFAKYLGHESSTSGPFRRRLSAFRDWNFVDYSNGRIALTELGKQVALPSDPSTVPRSLRRAFAGCDVFAEVYDILAKGVPLELEYVGNTAVHEAGVSVQSKTRFAESFARSAEFAGFGKFEGEGVITLHSTPMESTPTEVAGASSEPDQDSLGRREGVAEAIAQRWSIPDGEILFRIRTTEALPATSFGLIQEIVRLLEQLRDALTPAEED